MVVFFNLIGLGMLAVSFGVFCLLAEFAPQIGSNTGIAIALSVLFALDVAYRIYFVREKVDELKRQTASGQIKNPLGTDLIAVLPTPIGTAFSGNGGSLMLLPCWLFAILLACFFFLLFPGK